MAPSIKTLSAFWPEKARELRALLAGTVSPKRYESVRKWLAQCYHEPSLQEQTMCAVNEVIGGCGVEPIRGRYVDHYFQDIQAEYVNMGDTYDLTILHDSETGRYIVTSWGDWFERNERKRQLV